MFESCVHLETVSWTSNYADTVRTPEREAGVQTGVQECRCSIQPDPSGADFKNNNCEIPQISAPSASRAPT